MCFAKKCLSPPSVSKWRSLSLPSAYQSNQSTMFLHEFQNDDIQLLPNVSRSTKIGGFVVYTTRLVAIFLITKLIIVGTAEVFTMPPHDTIFHLLDNFHIVVVSMVDTDVAVRVFSD